VRKRESSGDQKKLKGHGKNNRGRKAPPKKSNNNNNNNNFSRTKKVIYLL
jgi:hypothetical protein